MGRWGERPASRSQGWAEQRVQVLFDLPHYHRDPSLQGFLPAQPPVSRNVLNSALCCPLSCSVALLAFDLSFS